MGCTDKVEMLCVLLVFGRYYLSVSLALTFVCVCLDCSNSLFRVSTQKHFTKEETENYFSHFCVSRA